MSILGKRSRSNEEGFFSTAAKVLVTSTLDLFSKFVRDNHDVETQPQLQPEPQPEPQPRLMPRLSKKKILSLKMDKLRDAKNRKRIDRKRMAIRAEIKANIEAELEIIEARNAIIDEENRKRKADEYRNYHFGIKLTFANSFRLGQRNNPRLFERSLFAEKKAKECEELARYYRHDGQSDLAKLYEEEADMLIDIAQRSDSNENIINILNKYKN